MTARLEKAGARKATNPGALAISLMWDHSDKKKRNDLDLWVRILPLWQLRYSIVEMNMIKPM
jgi:hypothetical protein